MSLVAKEGRRPPSEGKDVSAANGKPVARMNQPFDHWLHKQLHAMYDDIASEPLPDDLLQLIDSDADKTAESQPDEDSADDPNRDKN